MATTRLIPLHKGKRRTLMKALKDILDYAMNPLKTDGGRLVSSYECDPKTAAAEFFFSKGEYERITGRAQNADDDVIAYHIRQSFAHGEITPEEANEISYELAKSFTKGRNAFIVATHIDKEHIHSHIIFNSTNTDCARKFRNFKFSSFALRRVSDYICVKHSKSIIKKPKPSKGHYGTWLGDNKALSFKAQIKQKIDVALSKSPADFDDFLQMLSDDGCEVSRRGKHIRFRVPGQEQVTRMNTLGGEYTEAAIRNIITGKCDYAPRSTIQKSKRSDVNMLIDIEEKLRSGKGAGYEKWAKMFNLKQAAKTLIYLQENGLTDYAALEAKTAAAVDKFNTLADRIKELENSMNANADLQKHIINYAKTRAVYGEYRKAGYSKKYQSEHEAEILLHQASKTAFNNLGAKKLPTVSSLRAAYAPLLEEKKRTYKDYTAAKNAMRELLKVKGNADKLLEIEPQVSPHIETPGGR
jgi:hypothetical protein